MPLGFLWSEISEVYSRFCHFQNSAFEAKIFLPFMRAIFALNCSSKKPHQQQIKEAKFYSSFKNKNKHANLLLLL